MCLIPYFAISTRSMTIRFTFTAPSSWSATTPWCSCFKFLGCFLVYFVFCSALRIVVVPPSPSRIPAWSPHLILIFAFRLGQHLRRRLAGMWMWMWIWLCLWLWLVCLMFGFCLSLLSEFLEKRRNLSLVFLLCSALLFAFCSS